MITKHPLFENGECVLSESKSHVGPTQCTTNPYLARGTKIPRNTFWNPLAFSSFVHLGCILVAVSIWAAAVLHHSTGSHPTSALSHRAELQKSPIIIHLTCYYLHMINTAAEHPNSSLYVTSYYTVAISCFSP